MGSTLGERMGSKDEPPPWGALGRQEKAVSNVLPQSIQLSSSQERTNCGGFISCDLRDPVKEEGEQLCQSSCPSRCHRARG